MQLLQRNGELSGGTWGGDWIRLANRFICRGKKGKILDDPWVCNRSTWVYDAVICCDGEKKKKKNEAFNSGPIKLEMLMWQPVELFGRWPELCS